MSRAGGRARCLMAAVGLLSSVVFGGCARSAEAPGATPDRVRVVVLPFLSQMPLHVAAAEGYFAEQGLDVDLVRLGRNQDIMAVLAQGQVDAAAGMLTLNELSLIEAGAHIRVVAALSEVPADACAWVAVVARREHLESGALDDPERIRTLRFDVNPYLPLGYAVDLLLESHGLSLEDVATVDLPPPAALDGIARGAADVTADSEPWISMHLATGEAAVWRSVGQLIPDYVHSVVMFGPTLVDDRPEVGQRFMVAVLKAIDQLRQGKTARNVALVEQAAGLTREQIDAACWPTFRADGRVDPSAFRGYQAWSVEQGFLSRVLDDDEVVDDRFVEYANAQRAR